MDAVLARLKDEPCLSLDTETTGLRPFHGDRPFSLIVGTKADVYYFNFQPYPGLEDDLILGEAELKKLAIVLGAPGRINYLHNATFDLHMLKAVGVDVGGVIHDTQVGARLLFSDHFSYSLSSVAERAGLEKSDTVANYVAENHLYTRVAVPGKKLKERRDHYDRVPFDLIAPYGEQDARITMSLGEEQRRVLEGSDPVVAYERTPTGESVRRESAGDTSLKQVYETERALTRVVFHMEQRGVQVDLGYCRDAIDYWEGQREAAEAEWLRLTGLPYKEGPKALAAALPPSGKRTGKSGKDSFDADSLEILAGRGNEAAQKVLDIRDAKKRLDLLQGLLYHADSSGVIHASFSQTGTKTGRFSCREPNLQQLTKDEAGTLFPIRRALVPRPGYFFLMPDFDQMEYRIMLDYAGAYTCERALIEKILGGLDVHQATADGCPVQITRQQAKTVNFSILFGAGLDLLAARLKTSRENASRIKGAIFQSAPEIKIFLDRAQSVAAARGYVKSWLGRRWHCEDPRLAFRAPNFLCQGGSADVMKVAMVRIDELLARLKSSIALTIHDEIVFEIAEDEEQVVPEIKAIMESVYPHRYLPLTVGVDYSRKSLADREEWST
jgi:DNA polymerase-1